jgi:hypothetical protein
MRKRDIAIRGWKNPARRFVGRRVTTASHTGNAVQSGSVVGRGGHPIGGRRGRDAGLRGRGGAVAGTTKVDMGRQTLVWLVKSGVLEQLRML